VDGRLDEGVWALATPVSDFVQKEPVEGVLPTERTEIRFVYDDDALYVGARMYSSGGSSEIQAPLSRRDTGAQLAEFILISLDTYLDRRTAYSFGVTASGVRLDHVHLTDTEGNVDQRFDPVWEASVAIDAQGWTAEMWIPFTQLRFNEGREQTWGLNLHRWIPSKNEDDYWVAIPRTEVFWASRFGDLRGIRDIDQGSRVEVLPYMTGGSTARGDTDPATSAIARRSSPSGVRSSPKAPACSTAPRPTTSTPGGLEPLPWGAHPVTSWTSRTSPPSWAPPN
jgi:hypothetical protein